MVSSELRVYRADSRFDAGYGAALIALFREIADNRLQIRTLFMKDFRAAYRGAAFGVLWNFILPLVPISAYILLAELRVFPAREGLPAALYIASGATLWFLFTGLIRTPISIVASRTREVMKTALPLSSSIAASFAMLVFETAVRLVLLAVLLVVFQTPPAILSPLALGVALAGALFALSLGVFLSILNVVSPDIDRITGIVLTYGIFLSGVIFPVSSLGPLQALEIFNPFAVFIDAARGVLFFNAVPHPEALAAWTLAALALALVSARLFFIMEYRIRAIA